MSIQRLTQMSKWLPFMATATACTLNWLYPLHSCVETWRLSTHTRTKQTQPFPVAERRLVSFYCVRVWTWHNAIWIFEPEFLRWKTTKCCARNRFEGLQCAKRVWDKEKTFLFDYIFVHLFFSLYFNLFFFRGL